MHDFTALNWANELISRALAPCPGDLVIATKVGSAHDGLARPDQLRGQVEENLRQLGRDHLDVVNLRQLGLDSIAEHFGALAELRDAGLIRHLGISNARLEHLAQAQKIAPVVCVQNRYGVDFGRVNDEMLRTCGEQGIAFVPFFAVTATGREAGGVASNGAVLAIARAHGATSAQVRIAWTLRRGQHVLAIPGTGNRDHLAENIAAGTLRLSADELAAASGADGGWPGCCYAIQPHPGGIHQEYRCHPVIGTTMEDHVLSGQSGFWLDHKVVWGTGRGQIQAPAGRLGRDERQLPVSPFKPQHPATQLGTYVEP